MKASSFELEQATILASRLCSIALNNDAETFRAFAITAIAMALARHRQRYRRWSHDPAMV
jgi:hypothetical protein